MLMPLNLPPLAPFNMHTNNIGSRWAKSVSSFKLYLTATGIKDNAQKRALLLHLSSSDIFDTIEDTGDNIEDIQYGRH